MIQKIIQPASCLKPYIEYYYMLESRGLAEYSERQRVYPYGKIILVFHYKEPFYFQPHQGEMKQEPRTVICGQQTSFYDLTPSGQSGMIFVVFKTFGAGVFFNLPMTEITNQNIALQEILKEQSNDVEEKIQNAKDNSTRVKIIDEFMLKRLAQGFKSNDRFYHSFKNTGTEDRPHRVRDMAERANLSIKQYERRFSSFSGLNPKKYLQILRFQKALQQVKKYASLTHLAMDCGYHDQAHFIHEFKSLTGLTPGQFKKT